MNMTRPLVPGIVEPVNAMAIARSAMFVIAPVLMLVLVMAGLSDTVAGANSPIPRCWIDYPLDGSTLDAPGTYQIVVHSASPDGISQTEFSINDRALGTVSNQSESLAVGRQTWQPGAAGQFVIKTRCQDSKGKWGDYALATVIITGGAAEPITPRFIPPRLTLPLLPATGTSFSDMTLSADHFYYRGAGCGPKQVTISLKVTDRAGIDNTAIFFRLTDQSTQNATAWSSLPMQGVAGNAAGETNWSLTISPESNIPGFSTYTNAWFQFYFKAKNKAGVSSDSESYYQKVSLSGCAR
jgi:hypothetical protein